MNKKMVLAVLCVAFLFQANLILAKSLGGIDRSHEVAQKNLFKAAYRGDLPNLKKFLKAGADLYTYDKNGQGVIHFAVMGGKLPVVEYLLKEAQDLVHERTSLGLRPIHLAAREGKLEIVKYLVENKGAKAYVDIADYNNVRPIHYAAAMGHLDIIKYLLDKINSAKRKKALVNAKDKYNKRPIH